MNKFDQYIFGHLNVTILTDHRPLEAIMNTSLLAAPKRIQAMMLALQRYAFTVTWKPGKEQIIADLLSSHTRNCEHPEEPAARDHVFQLQKHVSKSTARDDRPSQRLSSDRCAECPDTEED